MKSPRNTFTVLIRPIVLALGVHVMGVTFAQDMERIKPAVAEPEPLAREEPEVQMPPEDEPADISEYSDEIVGEIKGIMLWGHPDQVQADNPPEVAGLDVGDGELPVPVEVMSALADYIDSPLSLKRVHEMARDVVLAYRKAGMPVVDVALPEQDVSGGILQLVVVLGRAGDINVTGTKYFDENLYLRSFRIQRGQVIKQDPLLDDLRYLNRNPYRQVGLVYSPGDEFAEADLTLEVEEKRPYSAYAGYDNTGNELIGEDRLFFGLEWGNVFGWDHILGYQYTTTLEFENLHAHALSYRLPIHQWRHEFQFLAGYVESGAELRAAGEVLETKGESEQLSGVYLIPLPKFAGYTPDLRLGFDFKSTNNNLEFGGATVADSTAEIFQFSAGLSAKKEQPFGRQFLSTQLVWSPGDLSAHNSDESFQELRGLGSADYLYWTGELTQIVNLPSDFVFVFKLEGQWSNGNLLPSEAMVLGGIGSVRGFEQNITRADEGIRLSAELYGPEFYPLNTLGLDLDEEKMRVFGFYDAAWACNVDRLPGEPDSQSLGGAGLGLEYRLASYLSLRLAYGWQLDQSGFEDGESARWHISTMVRF